ncbi:hypothetical protein [Sphaerisporangium album]|uniref:hypothetical protein n=1 Tax=Sphaerisporangium album TaxID=509200 RepID=UPI0011C05525|nr:hypothetical protein [Sphaerisporangium album]
MTEQTGAAKEQVGWSRWKEPVLDDDDAAERVGQGERAAWPPWQGLTPSLTRHGEHLGEIGDGVAVNAWRPSLNCAVAR